MTAGWANISSWIDLKPQRLALSCGPSPSRRLRHEALAKSQPLGSGLSSLSHIDYHFSSPQHSLMQPPFLPPLWLPEEAASPSSLSPCQHYNLSPRPKRGPRNAELPGLAPLSPRYSTVPAGRAWMSSAAAAGLRTLEPPGTGLSLSEPRASSLGVQVARGSDARSSVFSLPAPQQQWQAPGSGHLGAAPTQVVPPQIPRLNLPPTSGAGPPALPTLAKTASQSGLHGVRGLVQWWGTPR
eukprot:TRINITY_DN1740_c0_g1_i3.p1 TRINITY_DN1740_c0_g1~~TRINITY_DN1740_c0_g1_i3.p1  ORF type:complete len:240 (+),score=16.08 TRINITY_DN1740_c0_g1_i3:164-883(+)